MAASVERIKYDCTACGCYSGIEVSHAGGELTAEAQHLRISGRELLGTFVLLLCASKVKHSEPEHVRECCMRLR